MRYKLERASGRHCRLALHERHGQVAAGDFVGRDPTARTSTFDQGITRVLAALAQAVRARREALPAERDDA